ncbi:hypothetical protein HY643_01340 [Candidatus Woesearchaeota archaeon]|nr:hypothetical protein [Candidatus Woesearchaeota archaeon]
MEKTKEDGEHFCQTCKKGYQKSDLEKTVAIELQAIEQEVGYAWGIEWVNEKRHTYPKTVNETTTYNCPKCKEELYKEKGEEYALHVDVKKEPYREL